MLSSIAKNKAGVFLIVALTSIICMFLIIVFFLYLKSTYATFCSMAVISPFLALITGNSKRLILIVLIICLPITIDITINHTGHIGGAGGYIISFFDIVLGLLYFLWIIEIIKMKYQRIHLFLEITLPAIFLLFFAVLSIIPSAYPDYSIYEIIEMIKMYLAFFYLANNLKKKEDIFLIIYIFILSLMFEGLLGWMQHRYDEPFFPTALGGPAWIDSRVKGTWVSYNDFAWYLTFFLPLPMSLLFSKIKINFKILCFLALSTGTAALMWTESRASWIGLAISTFFVIMFVIPKIKSRKSLANAFLVFFILLILILPLYPRLYSKMYGRFIGPDKGSAESRIPQIKVAYKIIINNPIFGVGINTYSEIMNEYDDTNGGLDQITKYPVHNIFLHIAAEIGILGLIVFLWLNASIFYAGLNYIYRNQNIMSYVIIGLLGGILGHLTHGLFDTESIGSKLFMFMYIFAGIILSIKRQETL